MQELPDLLPGNSSQAKKKNGYGSVLRNDQGHENAQINCNVLVHISQSFSFLLLFIDPTTSVSYLNK